MRPHTAHTLFTRPGAGAALPDLRIVARDQVWLHEDPDHARVERLTSRLQREGILRNPPIAAAVPDAGYVILDGANRTHALAALDIPVLPLQVIDYDDPAVRVDVWSHLVVEPLDLLAAVRRAGVPVEPSADENAARRLADREIVCAIRSRGQTWVVPLSPSRLLAATLSDVVGTYKGSARIYRVPAEEVDALADAYGDVSAAVVFPRLRKQDILEIATSPAKLPTGITRHLIPGRALRLNLPLAALAASEDLAQKNRWLADLIRSRLRDHAVRHYPEGVFLFDE